MSASRLPDPHLSRARLYAGGVVAALSEHDAWTGHNERRADICLDEALSGLEAARRQVEAVRDARRNVDRPQPVVALRVIAASVLVFASAGLLFIPGLPS